MALGRYVVYLPVLFQRTGNSYNLHAKFAELTKLLKVRICGRTKCAKIFVGIAVNDSYWIDLVDWNSWYSHSTIQWASSRERARLLQTANGLSSPSESHTMFIVRPRKVADGLIFRTGRRVKCKKSLFRDRLTSNFFFLRGLLLLRSSFRWCSYHSRLVFIFWIKQLWFSLGPAMRTIVIERNNSTCNWSKIYLATMAVFERI